MLSSLWWIIGAYLSPGAQRRLHHLYPQIFSVSYWTYQGQRYTDVVRYIARCTSWSRVFRGTLTWLPRPLKDIGLAYNQDIVYDYEGYAWWISKSQAYRLPPCQEVIWIKDDLYYIDYNHHLHYLSPTSDIVLQGDILRIHTFRDRVYVLDTHHHFTQHHYDDFFLHARAEEENQPLLIQGQVVINIAVTTGTHPQQNYCWYHTEDGTCYCLSSCASDFTNFFAFYYDVEEMCPLDEAHMLLVGPNKIMRAGREVNISPFQVVLIHRVPFFIFPRAQGGKELISWTEYCKQRMGVRFLL